MRILVSILVLAGSSTTTAQTLSKTGWPAFRNDAKQTGVATSRLTPKPKLLWKFPSPDGWVSTVAIVGDHVYAPALEGFVYCLDRRTGKVVWKYRSQEDPKEFADGFKAAPRVTHDAVYVGDEVGTLHAIDRKTGQGRWKFETGGEIAGCAAIIGKNILIPSHDAHLYCLDEQGKVVWKFETLDRVNCSPAIAGDVTFVAGCDEHLRVIDLKKGKELRDVHLESYLIASPAVVGDELYVGTHTGEVVAVNWKTGKFVWRYRAEREMEFHASAAVTREVVLVGGHDKLLHCIDRRTGRPRWTFPTRAAIDSSPVVVDDRVFFGSNDGNIYGVSIKTGKQVWKHNAGKDILAAPAIGEGCMVVGAAGTNGRLYCFGSEQPEQKKSSEKKVGEEIRDRLQARFRAAADDEKTTRFSMHRITIDEASRYKLRVVKPDLSRHSMPNVLKNGDRE